MGGGMSDLNHWTSDQIERQKSFYESIRDHAKRAGQSGASTVLWAQREADALQAILKRRLDAAAA
jgi:hypothetical protein